jgi:ribosomal protein S3AE
MTTEGGVMISEISELIKNAEEVMVTDSSKFKIEALEFALKGIQEIKDEEMSEMLYKYLDNIAKEAIQKHDTTLQNALVRNYFDAVPYMSMDKTPNYILLMHNLRMNNK